MDDRQRTERQTASTDRPDILVLGINDGMPGDRQGRKFPSSEGRQSYLDLIRQAILDASPEAVIVVATLDGPEPTVLWTTTEAELKAKIDRLQQMSMDTNLVDANHGGPDAAQRMGEAQTASQAAWQAWTERGGQ